MHFERTSFSVSSSKARPAYFPFALMLANDLPTRSRMGSRLSFQNILDFIKSYISLSRVVY